MTERLDLTDGRSLVAELDGRAVLLTPLPDGSIAVTERSGSSPRIIPSLSTANLSVKIGDAVTWGSGQGAGYGVLMEIDTAEGNGTVHTCEVTDDGFLSPTGKTIKIDMSKLRASSKQLVGETPTGPELSSGDLLGTTVEMSDDEMYQMWLDVLDGTEANRRGDAAAAEYARHIINEGVFYG